jgi:hypothetical protein
MVLVAMTTTGGRVVATTDGKAVATTTDGKAVASTTTMTVEDSERIAATRWTAEEQKGASQLQLGFTTTIDQTLANPSGTVAPEEIRIDSLTKTGVKISVSKDAMETITTMVVQTGAIMEAQVGATMVAQIGATTVVAPTGVAVEAEIMGTTTTVDVTTETMIMAELARTVVTQETSAGRRVDNGLSPASTTMVGQTLASRSIIEARLGMTIDLLNETTAKESASKITRTADDDLTATMGITAVAVDLTMETITMAATTTTMATVVDATVAAVYRETWVSARRVSSQSAASTMIPTATCAEHSHIVERGEITTGSTRSASAMTNARQNKRQCTK